MPSEARAHWFVECRDINGQAIRIGAASTKHGSVVLLQPADVIPKLSQQQALDFAAMIRAAVVDAATRR